MSYFKSVGKEENMYLAIGILGLCVSGAFGIYLDKVQDVEFRGCYWVIGSLGTAFFFMMAYVQAAS